MILVMLAVSQTIVVWAVITPDMGWASIVGLVVLQATTVLMIGMVLRSSAKEKELQDLQKKILELEALAAIAEATKLLNEEAIDRALSARSFPR